MPLTVNTTRTGGNELPDVGVYKARIEAIEEREGNEFPYAAITLRLNIPNQPSGLRVWDNVSMAPGARFKVEQVLDALGVAEGAEFDLMTARNKVVYVDIEHDTYNGRVRPKVKTWMKPEEGLTLAEEQGHLSAPPPAAATPGARRPGAPAAPAAAGRRTTRPVAAAAADSDDEFPV